MAEVNLSSIKSGVRRLKVLLVIADTSLEQLAEATGLSLSLIKKIASGHVVPSKRAVARIEAHFGERIFSSLAQYQARKHKRSNKPRVWTARFGPSEYFQPFGAAAPAASAALEHPTAPSSVAPKSSPPTPTEPRRQQ